MEKSEVELKKLEFEKRYKASLLEDQEQVRQVINAINQNCAAIASPLSELVKKVYEKA